MSTAVDVDVYAHDRSASSTFDHVGKAATKNSGLIKKFGVSLAGAFTGAAIFNGARDLTHLLIGQTEAAAQDEQGQRQLALQLHNSAGANKAADASAEAWITTIGKQLGVTDDDLRPALARMVSATHDVSAAQDDVSLAMDISAGRHKSLQTVVEALAKAEQGNTSGLGRLGVATKDASGKALTLDQITQNLAKTYKGSAAAAADTAAGKYKIVDTQFHELGETIGYWLLPKAADFGAWILDTGVPAAQELAAWLGDELGPTVRDIGGWFSDNQDDIETFAKTIGNDVVGGLKDVVDIGADVVGFLDGLPSPVKSLAVEGALAALVLPRLAGGITAAGTAAVVAKGQITGFVTGLSDAERRSGLLSRSLLNVAGVGGMIAIEEGSRRGSDAVGILGGAMTGAFAGGTLGSAIPGIGTAVGALGGALAGTAAAAWQAGKKHEAAGQLVNAARVDYEDLRETLDNVTGAYTKETRAGVLDAAQKSGILALTSRMGVANRDLIGAVLGNRGATERLTSAYQENAGALDGTEQADFNTWLVNNTHQLAEQQDQVRDNSRDLKTWGEALKGLPPEVATKVKAIGTDITEAQLRQLKRQYDLSPKQVSTIVNAVGTEQTVRKIKGVWTVIEDGKAVRTDLNPWQQDLIGSLNDAGVAVQAPSIKLRRTIGETPSQARVNLDPLELDLLRQVDGMRGPAHTAGVGVGNSIEQGVQGGLAGIATMAAAAVHAAVAAAQAAVGGGGGGGDHGGGGGGKKGGGTSQRTLGDIVGDRLRGSSSSSWSGLGPNQLSHAGADLLASLVNGLEKGRKPLNRVLDAIKKDVANKLSARDQLQQLHDQLAGGFSGFKDSIFGVQATDEGPVTVEQLLAKAASEKAKAGQVDQDVQALLNAGVSEDMIKELQAQGASGIDALHALAGANADQLKQIVADNAAAQSSYLHAGQLAGDKFYSQAIEQANAQLAIALGVEKTVQKIDDLVGRLDKVEFILHGSDLVASLVKDKKEKGKQ